MAQEGQAIPQASVPPARTVQFGQTAWAWVGVTPFFIFALMFLIVPTLYLVVGAFQDAEGNFTLANLAQLFTSDSIRSAYWISIKVSVASAVVGLPLAFAFLATLGRTGIVTTLLITLFDFNIYRTGFNLLSFWGLTLTYLYFQIPLMVLIITPALDGLKREWREAASILGASHWEYWRHVALPILWPAIVGTTLLLFANSFGAIATAYALTGSSLNIVTILLYAQIRGDVLHDQNLGYALALGMIIITGVSNGAYIWLRARSDRWQR
jgi:putative spermidine/putrescine transport system permease protein